LAKIEDRNTRYFLEIDLGSLKITRCGFDQKQNLDSGRQTITGMHRLFLTRGQYARFVKRCENELRSVIDI
jgi:hypothetical protein